jgi:hypothetical protein
MATAIPGPVEPHSAPAAHARAEATPPPNAGVRTPIDITIRGAQRESVVRFESLSSKSHIIENNWDALSDQPDGTVTIPIPPDAVIGKGFPFVLHFNNSKVTPEVSGLLRWQ